MNMSSAEIVIEDGDRVFIVKPLSGVGEALSSVSKEVKIILNAIKKFINGDFLTYGEDRKVIGNGNRGERKHNGNGVAAHSHALSPWLVNWLIEVTSCGEGCIHSMFLKLSANYRR